MDKKSLNERASMAVQRYLLFTVLALETAVCHLLAAGNLYLMNAGVTGVASTLPFIAAVGVFLFAVSANLGSMIACARLIWFEKDDRGWRPFARLTLPSVIGQTALSATVWLLYPMRVQFIVGCAALMLAGVFFTLLKRSARKMPNPPEEPTDEGGI